MAIATPVLLVLMLSGFDLTQWIRSEFRLDETVAGMGEVISQCKAINDPADIQQFDINAQLLAGTTDLTSQTAGAFIMSGVGFNAKSQLVVLWQRRTGNPQYASRIGPVGSVAALGAYRPPAGEVVITTEAFSGVQPWTLGNGLMTVTPLPAMYSSAVFLVRSSNAAQLAALTPDNTGTLACAS